MERDGVGAVVIYPNDSLALFKFHDSEYQMAVARAYNDWLIELFGGHSERLAPVTIIPVADIGQAIKEVERVARLGCRTIKIPIIVNQWPYNLPEYKPL
jgi:predicted TIM-barrel fold metal-dependent hydrolase